MLHGRRGHQTLAQTNGVFFTLGTTTDFTYTGEQEVCCIHDALVFAVLAHIEELEFHRIVCDKRWELCPLKQSYLTPTIQVIAPLRRNAHLVQLLNCFCVG